MAEGENDGSDELNCATLRGVLQMAPTMLRGLQVASEIRHTFNFSRAHSSEVARDLLRINSDISVTLVTKKCFIFYGFVFSGCAQFLAQAKLYLASKCVCTGNGRGIKAVDFSASELCSCFSLRVVVPQLKTSWLGPKSSLYACVTQQNNTPDPKGSCIVREHLAKKNPRFGSSAGLQR